MTKDGSSLPRPRCTGAILAGGQALRFGGLDKPALVVEGRRILDRQLDALRRVTREVMIVANDRQRYEGYGVPVVADVVPQAGPLGGIHTALISASTPLVVVVAGDMPFVTSALLTYLAQRATRADAAVPVLEDGPHPLCAAYSVRAAASIERRLRGGRFKVQDALDDLRTVRIAHEELRRFGDPVRLLANINTPEDLARLAGAAEIRET